MSSRGAICVVTTFVLRTYVRKLSRNVTFGEPVWTATYLYTYPGAINGFFIPVKMGLVYKTNVVTLPAEWCARCMSDAYRLRRTERRKFHRVCPHKGRERLLESHASVTCRNGATRIKRWAFVVAGSSAHGDRVCRRSCHRCTTRTPETTGASVQ